MASGSNEGLIKSFTDTRVKYANQEGELRPKLDDLRNKIQTLESVRNSLDAELSTRLSLDDARVKLGSREQTTSEMRQLTEQLLSVKLDMLNAADIVVAIDAAIQLAQTGAPVEQVTETFKTQTQNSKALNVEKMNDLRQKLSVELNRPPPQPATVAAPVLSVQRTPFGSPSLTVTTFTSPNVEACRQSNGQCIQIVQEQDVVIQRLKSEIQQMAKMLEKKTVPDAVSPSPNLDMVTTLQVKLDLLKAENEALKVRIDECMTDRKRIEYTHQSELKLALGKCNEQVKLLSERLRGYEEKLDSLHTDIRRAEEDVVKSEQAILAVEQERAYALQNDPVIRNLQAQIASVTGDQDKNQLLSQLRVAEEAAMLKFQNKLDDAHVQHEVMASRLSKLKLAESKTQARSTEAMDKKLALEREIRGMEMEKQKNQILELQARIRELEASPDRRDHYRAHEKEKQLYHLLIKLREKDAGAMQRTYESLISQLQKELAQAESGLNENLNQSRQVESDLSKVMTQLKDAQEQQAYVATLSQQNGFAYGADEKLRSMQQTAARLEVKATEEFTRLTSMVGKLTLERNMLQETVDQHKMVMNGYAQELEVLRKTVQDQSVFYEQLIQSKKDLKDSQMTIEYLQQQLKAITERSVQLEQREKELVVQLEASTSPEEATTLKDQFNRCKSEQLVILQKMHLLEDTVIRCSAERDEGRKRILMLADTIKQNEELRIQLQKAIEDKEEAQRALLHSKENMSIEESKQQLKALQAMYDQSVVKRESDIQERDERIRKHEETIQKLAHKLNVVMASGPSQPSPNPYVPTQQSLPNAINQQVQSLVRTIESPNVSFQEKAVAKSQLKQLVTQAEIRPVAIRTDLYRQAEGLLSTVASPADLEDKLRSLKREANKAELEAAIEAAELKKKAISAERVYQQLRQMNHQELDTQEARISYELGNIPALADTPSRQAKLDELASQFASLSESRKALMDQDISDYSVAANSEQLYQQSLEESLQPLDHISAMLSDVEFKNNKYPHLSSFKSDANKERAATQQAIDDQSSHTESKVRSSRLSSTMKREFDLLSQETQNILSMIRQSESYLGNSKALQNAVRTVGPVLQKNVENAVRNDALDRKKVFGTVYFSDPSVAKALKVNPLKSEIQTTDGSLFHTDQILTGSNVSESLPQDRIRALVQAKKDVVIVAYGYTSKTDKEEVARLRFSFFHQCIQRIFDTIKATYGNTLSMQMVVAQVQGESSVSITDRLSDTSMASFDCVYGSQTCPITRQDVQVGTMDMLLNTIKSKLIPTGTFQGLDAKDAAITPDSHVILTLSAGGASPRIHIVDVIANVDSGAKMRLMDNVWLSYLRNIIAEPSTRIFMSSVIVNAQDKDAVKAQLALHKRISGIVDYIHAQR